MESLNRLFPSAVDFGFTIGSALWGISVLKVSFLCDFFENWLTKKNNFMTNSGSLGLVLPSKGNTSRCRNYSQNPCCGKED